MRALSGPRVKSRLRLRMEMGALTAIGIVVYGFTVWAVSNALWYVWHPLGWLSLAAGVGGAVGAFVHWALTVEL